MEWTIGWWQVSVQRVYPTTTQLSQTYNRAADWWHQHLRLLGYSHAYRQLWRKLLNANILPSGKDNLTVCDCGIGTAAFSLAFAQTISATVHITGVDLSSKMLDRAHQQLSQANIRHQICQSDVNMLPFADNSFDAVISAHMLEHLPNPARGLQEIVRVLRPGAPLILVVTQSGLLGWSIGWHWGNRCFRQPELLAIVRDAGLTHLQFFSFPIGLARFTSFACVGFRRIDDAQREI
ncbi:class I SAM-dependent methyltransferase [Chroococcidiopsis sp. CCNUC1]|uniref:class I SAM-dependent methyltransferase n=1 Tax=Chroococcidiopsis sp. CCNUC1 TaxID=2653189 RepID=UPI000D07D4D2|nr:class I SAM-dependent methyltransferase [Chroococcidiopsis sp. CCNUC1]PSB49504.1 SAM-dependent methyltransferase [Cyanosarcina cf. burmensis CCALA 770]URD53843.1 methyltransferase domain-containing protein [Chroococcidiopsis sp. CCNUC1]